MRRLLGMLLFGLVLTSAAALGADETVSITLPPDQTTLVQGPGREVTEAQCRMCHSLDYVTMQPRGGAAQWQGVVAKMRTVFGAPLSDADAKAIADYLTAQYGPR
jgi:mono/diheme cytochrome c family protein